ncbi:hypothetical protein K505DRAFT_258541 [Melanomma pulvis-pyrius CBS 109.77]|uniref:NB-ARC domain-containing protein n=1 Tax=Melanomma pulvis-pyrius CBS 109.77 TaxID=1314802 RepID=A0A6A6WSW5_9PLEO|nr:hypothetical protein K505DRAFT_258541 [Melanomma pulvis-pyrius CBS 109.77]
MSSCTSTVVVWGLGGAGKTQLVLDYVQQYRTEYRATLWMETGLKESLERDFVSLYQTLFDVHSIPGQETVSSENAVTAVKSWLSGRQGPWLLAFDGADAINDTLFFACHRYDSERNGECYDAARRRIGRRHGGSTSL